MSSILVLAGAAAAHDVKWYSILEATIATGTLDSLRAGRRTLERQREFLVRFCNRYLDKQRGSDDDAVRPG